LVYYPGHTGEDNVSIDVSRQRIYFQFDIFELSYLKAGAVKIAEGAGVIRAAAGKRKKIASPLAWRSNDIGSIKAHDNIQKSPYFPSLFLILPRPATRSQLFGMM
jgi:hypothetical protein